MRRSFWFWSRHKISTLEKSGRVAGRALGVLFLMAWMTAVFGCDSRSFVPPPPDELAQSDDATVTSALPGPPGAELEPASAKTLEVFLDRCPSELAELLKSAARTQAGLNTVKLNITILGEHDLPAR
jgi:hypothetical protein